MLGFGAEVRHGVVESELVRPRASGAAAARAARKSVFDARFARTAEQSGLKWDTLKLTPYMWRIRDAHK